MIELENEVKRFERNCIRLATCQQTQLEISQHFAAMSLPLTLASVLNSRPLVRLAYSSHNLINLT